MRKVLYSILFILTGCSAPAYIQDSLDLSNPSSYSRISVDFQEAHKAFSSLDMRVSFSKVNGKDLEIAFTPGTGPDQINLLPGTHKLIVRYEHQRSFATSCLQISTEPGTNYILKKKFNNYGVLFWLEKTTGETVGNLCGQGS